MNARYVDAHCHLQFGKFDADREEIIARMREQGVAAIVVGVDGPSSEAAVALAEAHEHLYAAVGLHPNDTPDEAFDPARYGALAAHPKVVAIGECGLDYFRPELINEEVKEAQCALFRAQVALAAELDKPLIIHARPSKGTQDAYADLIELLREARATHGARVRGDVHFFVGGGEQAEALYALGFTVSFTAVITFARDYDAVIRAAPLESILSETDAPYVAPVSRRGQRNDPLAVTDVALTLAALRGEDPEKVRKTLVESALRVFVLPGLRPA